VNAGAMDGWDPPLKIMALPRARTIARRVRVRQVRRTCPIHLDVRAACAACCFACH